MKKYNTPEIEALALETIDVIATSGDRAAEALLDGTYNKVEDIAVSDFVDNNWSW